MKPSDVDLSRTIAEAMRPPPAPGGCWRNAFRAIPDLAEVVGSAPLYVEGHVTIPGVRTVAHAWLEAEGRIVDVSLDWSEDAAQLSPMVRHLPSRRFTVAEVCVHLDRRGSTLPISGDLAVEELP